MDRYVIFFFNDTATTEIYTLSLHDALPIWRQQGLPRRGPRGPRPARRGRDGQGHRRQRPRLRAVRRRPARVREDRKSTRLNSSHANISYAVFCLKKKNQRRATLNI